MAHPSCIREGDTVLLKCSETKAYVVSVATSLSKGKVRLHPDPRECHPESDEPGDQIFRNVHFAAFQIISEPWNTFITNLPSPLMLPKNEPLISSSKHDIFTSAIYGRKIKLRHVALDMYLSVDDNSDNLILVKEDMKEDIRREDDACVFRILPTQMGQAKGEISIGKKRGDTVSSGDEVVLESVKKKGCHLLSCKSTDPQRNDLKIAVANSSFVIERYTDTSSFKSSEAIRGGSVIRFRNIEVDGFLAGSAADAITVRKKWSFHGMKRLPPVSGDCWWQLEKVDSKCFYGGPIYFKEKYYIKHVPTQRYLKVQISEQSISLEEPSTVDRKYKLILEKSCGSTFLMISRDEGSDSEVLKGSLMKLQWFNNDIDSDNGDSKPDLFLSIQGDRILPKVFGKKRQIGGKLFNLSLKEKNADDFRIEEVTPNHVHNLYFVASISNVLQDYNKSIQRDSSYKSDELNTILDELVKWIDKDITTGSKILRIYRVVDILVNILKRSVSSDIQRKVCIVLEHYARTPSDKSRKYLTNENYLVVLIRRLGDNVHVEKVLGTLVYHDSEIANSVMLKIKELLPDKLNPAVLELYSALCFTSDLPNRELQDQVFQTIIERRQKSFYATEIKGDEVYFVSQEDQGLEGPSLEVQGPISLICQSDDDKRSFFIAQLKLFSRVCKGMNTTSIDKIKIYRGIEWPIFDEALIVIKDSKVPSDVKSAYLDLVESVYIEPSIDRNGRCIDDLWHCYLWENLTNTDPLKASNVSRYSVDSLEDATNIRELISIIGKKVKNPQVLNHEKSDTELLAQMLEVMERLTAYAYCWDVSKDTGFDLASLVVILDRTDHYADNNEQNEKDNNEHIFKIKRIAVKLLHGFFKQLSYLACAKLLIEFKCRKDSTNPGLDPLLKESFNISSLEIDVLDRQCQTLAAFFETRGDYKCFDVDDPGSLVVILQKLMCYEDVELRVCSANLLYAIYKKEHKLFEDAKCSYIYTAVDQKDPTQYRSIYNWSLREGALTKESELKTFVDATHPTDNLPVFIKKLKKPFLFVQNEVCPRSNYQNIVYTTGVYSALLIFVFKHFSKDYENGPEKDKIKKLLVDVCDVLQKLCRGNKMIQQKMFLHFTDFYEVKIAISSVACLLTEIITDHVELCRDFSEGDIRQLYILACTGTSNETKEYLDFFTTLEAVMKPSKSKSCPLLKNYQEKIARMLNENFQYKYHFFSLMLEDKANERLTVLSKNTPNDDVKLLTLLNVSSLLATCAEGRGKFAEVVCHKIFTVEELMCILVNNDVPRQRKVPFARLLNEGCIYSEKFSRSSLHELKNKDSDFWKHIDACTFFVNHHIDTFGDEKFMFLFKRLFSEHISWTKVWKLDDESSTEEISFGLFYLVDGVIPLITSFCNELNSDELDERQQDKLKQFGDAVLKLLNEDLAPIFLTCKAHTEFWDSCFNSIDKVVPSEQYKTATAKIGQQYFKFEELVEYEAEVAEEDGLNSLFHKFISNYQKVYEQGSDNGNQDNDDTELHECQTQLVPSGRSFTRIVKLFCDNDPSEETKGQIKMTKPLSDMLEVLYNQLRRVNDCINRDQLNEVLCFTLQILFGVLNERLESVNALREKMNESEVPEEAKKYEENLIEIQNYLKMIYEKAAFHLVHPDDDVAVQVLGLIYVTLCKCDNEIQKKMATWISYGDANFFIRLHKLLATAISCFSYYRSVQDVTSISSGPHVQFRDQSVQQTQQQQDDDNEPETSKIYSIESAGQLEVTEEEAIKHVNVVLNLIIKMCDGQVKAMQNILRFQEHNISINIVGEVTELLQTLAEHKNPDISVVIRSLQALIELCGGNHKNQNVAVNGQVIDSLNLILTKGPEQMNWEHIHMQCKALELLEILLEETSPCKKDCQRVGKAIAKDIKREIIEATMRELYQIKENPDITGLSNDDKVKSEIIDIATVRSYHIIRKVADFLVIPVEKYAPRDTDDKVWQYVEDKTCHIEVNYTNSMSDNSIDDDAVLTSVYFRFDSEKLTENEKHELQFNIKRDSLEDKAKDLLVWAESVHKNLEYRKNLWFRDIINKLSAPLHYTLCFMTLLLSLIVLFVFKISDNSITIGNNSSFIIVLFPSPTLSFQIVYRQLAIFHVVLSQLMVFEYFYLMRPNFYYKIPIVNKKLMELREWCRKFKWLNDKCEKLKEKGWFKKIDEKEGFEIYFFGLYTIYRLFFLVCSLLGLLLSGYFYFLCLPYIFIKIDVVHHVVRAIGGACISIFYVILLILSIILIYAAISFAFISTFFESDQFCQTLFECTITVMRGGLVDGAIPVGQQSTFRDYFGRSLIDLTFFVIVGVVFLEVIAALLIDKFSELRAERDAAENDKKDFCFVCGIESDRFERRGRSFEDHYRDDHNMYNYMYFFHHVKSKEPKDHNAIEKYVYDCFKKKDYKFLPLRKARALGGKVSTKYEQDFVKLEKKQRSHFTKLEKNQQEILEKIDNSTDRP